MNKIRTVSQLQEKLDGEMSWREKEIHDLQNLIRTTSGPRQRTLIRAGVPLIYAHWEGFVKTSAEHYLNFLSNQGFKYADLQRCFVALGLRVTLQKIAETGKSDFAIMALGQLLSKLDGPAEIPYRGSIETGSNLNSEVFQNIAGWLGFDCSRYSTRFNLIDVSLLKRRNSIAHGEFLDLDEQAFRELSLSVADLLRWFKTDIENALTMKSYKSQT